jgi:hypothetical protein
LAKVGGGVIPSASGVKAPDRGLPAREGATLVTIEACEPFDPVEIAGRNRAVIKGAARLPHPEELDVGQRDLRGAFAAGGAGLGTGLGASLGATDGVRDRPFQRHNRVRPERISARRAGQTMTTGALRRARLAGGCPRAGAPLRIATVGVDLAQARHAALILRQVS